MLVSYAQNAEDVRLARVLPPEVAGFYVDLGAGDPVEDSVTKLFYDRGWTGINVEPGPQIERLRADRPRDVNLPVAVSTVDGPREFWISSPHPGISSLLPPAEDLVLPEGFSMKRRSVLSRPLSSILEEHAAGRHIDFVKIDVEGAELDVLESFDLGAVRPTVLVVEAVALLTSEPTHGPWEPLVLDAGFVLAAFDGVNRFYVPREHEDLIDALAYPISPLDNYVHHRELDLHARLADLDSPRPDDPRGAAAYFSLRDLADLDVRRQAPQRPGGKPLVLLDPAGGTSRESTLATIASLERHTAVGSYVLAAEDEARVLLTTGDTDVVLVEAGIELSPSWLERLAATAHGDSMCASASAQVVSRSDPSPVAATRQLPFAPLLPAPAWGVVYLRRDALNLTAPSLEADTFDAARIGASLEAALTIPGLLHRLAENVVVRAPGRTEHSPLLDRSNGHAPSRSGRRDAATLSRGVRVMVDGRCLDMPLSGTQVHVLSLLKALGDTGVIGLSVLLSRQVHPTVEPYLAAVTTADGIYTIDDLPETMPAVFHRPYQFSTVEEVDESRHFGQRLVLTHQDMILDRTPSYYASDDWARLRETTAAAFEAADQVGFFSRHAAWDAASDGLLDAERVNVVPLGVDHPLDGVEDAASPAPPSGAPADAHYVLVIGGAYRHKNRLFALRTFERLRSQQHWDGTLVLAGDHPEHGSSVPEEDAFLAAHPEVKSRVVDLGRVTDAEKEWLYAHARLVLFPSLYEGFGLIPFEAASCGTPCVYGWRSSLPEYLPRRGAVLEGWDAARSAEEISKLLEDEARSAELVRAIQEAGSHLTWARTATGYLEVYRRALGRPADAVPGDPPLVRPPARGAALGDAEARLLDVYRRRRVFRRTLDAVVGAGASVRSLGRRIRRSSS